MSDERVINSELALVEYIRDLRAAWYAHPYLIVQHRTGKQRTLTQNRALHLWLGMLADMLNAAGFDMRKTLKQDVEIPWKTETAKEFLWRPVQEAVINKTSTTEADRVEYSEVYEVLTRHLASKLGITAPEWPRKQEEETHE